MVSEWEWDNTSTWWRCAYEDKPGKRTLQFQGKDKNSLQVYRDHITVSRRWQNYANVSLWRPLYYVKTMVKQCYIKWLRPHCNVKLWCQNLVSSWSNDRRFCICSPQRHRWTCAPAQNNFVAPTLDLSWVGSNFSQTSGWKLRAFELLEVIAFAFADAGLMKSTLPSSPIFFFF